MEREEVLMTNDEFDVLDELYFVQNFDEIIELTSYKPERLLSVLKSLKKNEWIKVLMNADEEWASDDITNDQYLISHFLATKKGLMAHNS